MIFLKFICYIIYSISVVIFLNYIDILYSFNYYIDWLFSDVKNMSQFNYIIVGAGSAGSVLAEQLSKTGADILLIEAGGAPIPFLNIPIITPLLLNTKFNWKYLTVPQENACKGLNNNQSNWPSGKILGGSSRINNMVYVVGHPNDYKSWLSDFREPIVEKRGSLHIDQNWYSKVSDAILQGITEMSYSVRNINTELKTGFMKTYLTSKNGERWSTDRAILKNNNIKLKIILHSFVKKILFKKNKAIGVQFVRKNQVYKAFAKNGIILSAGAVGSPKLLMLSGVGPKQHLEELKIKVVSDLPVGQHLMDHIMTGFDLVTLNDNVALKMNDVVNPISMLEYYLFGTGPWTSSGVDVIGTFHSVFQNNTLSAPDLQIIAFPVGLSQDNGILIRKNMGISDKIFNEYFAPLAYKTAISIAPILLHPKSIGEIKLKSSNPDDDPLIDPKYLSHEQDVLTLVDGIQFIKKLVETNAMKKFGARFYKKPFPGCENIAFDTMKYWKCYIKHLTLTVYHPAGTCKMGDVVNSEYRVHKTQNLFVVDASVFPVLPSGNTNAPVVMLAEKAAKQFIKYFESDAKMQKCYKIDFFLSFY